MLHDIGKGKLRKGDGGLIGDGRVSLECEWALLYAVRIYRASSRNYHKGLYASYICNKTVRQVNITSRIYVTHLDHHASIDYHGRTNL